MRSGRSSVDYLQDIVDAIRSVEEFTVGITIEQFLADKKTAFAVRKAIEIIGEATKQIPASVRNRHLHVPWTRMAGMRDRLVHAYFGVDLNIVWETATQLIPQLRPDILKFLESEIQRELGAQT